MHSGLGRVPADSVRGLDGADRTSRFEVRRTLIPASPLAGFGGPAGAGIQSPPAAVPIWFAALWASHCQAKAKGEDRSVSWDCVSGRAIYTNRGAEEETIEPLGVRLQKGHTVAVSWNPGETAYTVEIFRQFDCMA